MEVEQSNDDEIWTIGSTTTLQVPVNGNSGKKFFRFRMDDSATFSPDWTPPVGAR